MKTLSNFKQINENSRWAIEKQIDVDKLIEMLKIALAEELIAWWQYTSIIPLLNGVDRKCVEEFYKEAAKDELEDHADWLMNRIDQLGGNYVELLDPANWDKVALHKKFIPNRDINCSLNQNIKAEIGAIETYTAIEVLTRDKDVITNKKVKEILADETEHLQELENFKDDISNKCYGNNCGCGCSCGCCDETPKDDCKCCSCEPAPAKGVCASKAAIDAFDEFIDSLPD